MVRKPQECRMFKRVVYQAAVSEEAREMHCTLSGPFAFWISLGERTRFSSHFDVREVLFDS